MAGTSVARFIGDGVCFVRIVAGGPTSFARAELGELMQAAKAAIRTSMRMGAKLTHNAGGAIEVDQLTRRSSDRQQKGGA